MRVAMPFVCIVGMTVPVRIAVLMTLRFRRIVGMTVPFRRIVGMTVRCGRIVGMTVRFMSLMVLLGGRRNHVFGMTRIREKTDHLKYEQTYTRKNQSHIRSHTEFFK